MKTFQDILREFRQGSASEREKGGKFERLMRGYLLTSKIYAKTLTISDIPLEAYDYVVNGKSAIEWIMERYQVTTDSKSGIVNNPNDWSKEHDDEKYIFNLVLRIITVSIETMKIVKGLPKLKFE